MNDALIQGLLATLFGGARTTAGGVGQNTGTDVNPLQALMGLFGHLGTYGGLAQGVTGAAVPQTSEQLQSGTADAAPAADSVAGGTPVSTPIAGGSSSPGFGMTGSDGAGSSGSAAGGGLGTLLPILALLLHHLGSPAAQGQGGGNSAMRPTSAAPTGSSAGLQIPMLGGNIGANAS